MKFKEDKCPNCGQYLDAHTNLKKEVKPKVGDVGICYKCCSILVFDEDLNLAIPNREQLERINSDKEFMAEIFSYITLLNLRQQ